MLLRILYHDHCFDGAASAAYFSRFIAGAVHPDAEFRYTGMAHKASQDFDPELFDGDENAIVDFKYSSEYYNEHFGMVEVLFQEAGVSVRRV